MAVAAGGFKETVDRPGTVGYTPAMSVALLALLLQGAPVQPRVFEGLRSGDHVEITLKNRYSFRGLCFTVPEDRKQLTIKLLGYPDVTGNITFKEMNVLRVRRLKPLTGSAWESMLNEIEEARARLDRAETERQMYEKDMAAKRAAEEAALEEEEAKRAEEAEKQSKARKFFERFPESKGWGEKAYEAIKNKTFPTPEEQQFYNQYDLWLEGKSYVESGD